MLGPARRRTQTGASWRRSGRTCTDDDRSTAARRRRSAIIRGLIFRPRPMELAKSFEPKEIEQRWYPAWESRGYFAVRCRRQESGVLHPASAAQCHRHPAHGSRIPADAHGRIDPLPPHARLRHQLGGRHGPRRNRHADRSRAPAGARKQDPARSGARPVRRTRLGMETAIGIDHHPADAPPRHVGELGVSPTPKARRAATLRWTQRCRAPSSKSLFGCTIKA